MMQCRRFGAHWLGDVGDRRQPLAQRAKIKTGAPDQDRQTPGGGRSGDLGEGLHAPLRRRAAPARIEIAIEAMRRPSFGDGIGPGGQDAQVAIALQAVGIDDDAAEIGGKGEGEPRFSARRRPGDDDDGRRRLVGFAGFAICRRAVRIALTLIAGPAGRAALPGIAIAIAEALSAAGPIWLAEGEACDICFDTPPTGPAEAAARAVLGDAAIDVVIQPAAGRRKRLLVADLESTIIENEMLDDLAGVLGIGPRVAEITRRAMNGEIDFTAAIEARVALLAGIENSVLEKAAAGIRLTPGARTLVATMHRAGARTALVSGGFTVFAERVATALGFDHVIANRLEFAGSRLAGRVLSPIVTGETKRRTLLGLVADYGLSPAETIAVGDGANDLAMLGAAGLGIAFHAKPMVAAAARWRIDHADLTALLYAQGYRAEEIAG